MTRAQQQKQDRLDSAAAHIAYFDGDSRAALDRRVTPTKPARKPTRRPAAKPTH